MLFSSISFLFYFLPAVLLLYFLVPKQKTMFWANLVLLLSSLFFYAWGEPRFVILMAISIALGYLSGLFIENAEKKSTKKAILIVFTVFILGALGYFKYAGFFTENLQKLFPAMPVLRIALPIGISFYTFQILSYAIDVYRGTTPAQKSFVAFGAYISMFPQLIAGPIVRYCDIAPQLTERKTTLTDIQEGIALFIVGLSKKILLANQLGEFCDIFRSSGEKSVLFYWLYAVAYALHIFFDFSGYSDMAIGLGRIFGFRFMPNFNYPFISRSVTEFWRRWHMSLGTWFRDYVYIPMGGNRVSPLRHVFNILVVWALTGFWHGAEWTFLLWGLFYAILLIFEKLAHPVLEKIPGFIRFIGTALVTLIGFVLFAANGLPQAISDITCLFSRGYLPLVTPQTIYYMQSFLIVIALSVFAATPAFSICMERLGRNTRAKNTLAALRPVALVVLLVLCTAYLVDGSFNPFLYFRF